MYSWLYTIQVLYAGENKLKCLPDDIGHMSGLSEFDVSNCELTRLPESLSSCTSLTKLWVSHNRFVLHSTFTHTLINSYNMLIDRTAYQVIKVASQNWQS